MGFQPDVIADACNACCDKQKQRNYKRLRHLGLWCSDARWLLRRRDACDLTVTKGGRAAAQRTPRYLRALPDKTDREIPGICASCEIRRLPCGRGQVKTDDNGTTGGGVS